MRDGRSAVADAFETKLLQGDAVCSICYPRMLSRHLLTMSSVLADEQIDNCGAWHERARVLLLFTRRANAAHAR